MGMTIKCIQIITRVAFINLFLNNIVQTHWTKNENKN